MRYWIGAVDSLCVNEDLAWVKVDTGDGMATVFLWSDLERNYAPAQRIIHGMWVALLRDALVSGKHVNLETNSSSDMFATSVVMFISR